MPAGRDLVSGGAGFIGGHLVEGLLARGRRVRVVDDLSTGRDAILARFRDDPAVEILVGDLADPETARAAVEGVERAFHLAARPSVPWSIEHPEAARRANQATTLSLIDAARGAGVARIVFSSTSAIYGEDPRSPKREDFDPDPRSPYAEHKLAGERALAAAAASGGPEAVVLRYFNVYGPRQDPSSAYSGVISLFARWAVEGAAPRIHGDGLQTRDFVFVRDVVDANLRAAWTTLADPRAVPVLNVARGESVTILELWKAVCRAAGVEPRAPEHLPPRPGDVRHSRADVRRAADMLDFRARTDLASGLRETVLSR